MPAEAAGPKVERFASSTASRPAGMAMNGSRVDILSQNFASASRAVVSVLRIAVSKQAAFMTPRWRH